MKTPSKPPSTEAKAYAKKHLPPKRTTGALLFGPMTDVAKPKRGNSVKEIADRAEATASMTRRAAERQTAAADGVDLKSLPDPINAEEYWTHCRAWIGGMVDWKVARKRWADEAALRVKCEVDPKMVKLLTAGLDGCCARLGERRK